MCQAHNSRESSQPRSDEEAAANRDAEMVAEAKLLRQHKGRLEARMRILEDHNRQLEAQLQRLRQLLDQVKKKSLIAFYIKRNLSKNIRTDFNPIFTYCVSELLSQEVSKIIIPINFNLGIQILLLTILLIRVLHIFYTFFSNIF